MKSTKSKSLNGNNSIAKEAMRYIDNAVKILNNDAKKEGIIFTDKKYVKMAGHTAYTGILFALDNAKILPPLKKNQRHDVKDYQAALSKQNKKMLNYFNDCYQQFHLILGYDGYGHKEHINIALNEAQEIINWASNKVS